MQGCDEQLHLLRFFKIPHRKLLFFPVIMRDFRDKRTVFMLMVSVCLLHKISAFLSKKLEAIKQPGRVQDENVFHYSREQWV